MRGNNYAFEILRFAQNDKEIGRRETVDGIGINVLVLNLYSPFSVSRLPFTEIINSFPVYRLPSTEK